MVGEFTLRISGFMKFSRHCKIRQNRSDGLHMRTLNVLPSKKIGVASDLPNQGHDGLAVSAIGYCR
jgi:hypothetical protein